MAGKIYFLKSIDKPFFRGYLSAHFTPPGVKHKEEEMLQVSEKANEMIKEFLKGRSGPLSIRIFMTAG